MVVSPPLLVSPGCIIYLFGPFLDPALRILPIHPPTHLQPIRPRPQCTLGRFIAAGTKHDDVTARDIVALVEVCEMGRGLRCDEVGFEVGGVVVGEGTANNLLYNAAVDIDAASEFRHFVSALGGVDGRSCGVVGLLRRMTFWG